MRWKAHSISLNLLAEEDIDEAVIRDVINKVSFLKWRCKLCKVVQGEIPLIGKKTMFDFFGTYRKCEENEWVIDPKIR